MREEARRRVKILYIPELLSSVRFNFSTGRQKNVGKFFFFFFISGIEVHFGQELNLWKNAYH